MVRLGADIRILVFADWYAPGFKAGGPIRSCVNFSDNMKGDREIFVFTSDRDLGESGPYLGIESDKWIEQKEIKVLYATPQFLNWRNIRRVLNEVEPDYIYLNSMYSRYFALYPLLIKWLGLTDATVILAPRGMLKKSALQFRGPKKRIFLFIFRLFGVHRKVAFHATDDTEVNDVRRIFGEKVKCSQASNFPSSDRLAFSYIKKKRGELKVVFVGRIHPIKNLLLLLNYIKPLQADIFLTIVGTPEDEEYWNKCRLLIKELSPNIRVIFNESIPNSEIVNLIADHHIFALPTEGENFGHAIFEALSTGRPVLISDQTPWRDLETEKAGWDIPLSEPGRFAATIERVAAMDQEEYLEWCRGAWVYAQKKSDNIELKKKYKALFA